MSQESGTFYSFHHSEPEVISKVVQGWGDKRISGNMNGYDIYDLEYGTGEEPLRIAWAQYSVIVTVANSKELSEMYAKTIDSCINGNRPVERDKQSKIVTLPSQFEYEEEAIAA